MYIPVVYFKKKHLELHTQNDDSALYTLIYMPPIPTIKCKVASKGFQQHRPGIDQTPACSIISGAVPSLCF